MAQAKAFSSISARLAPELAQMIMDEAEKRGVSNRVVIADALKEHFERQQPRTLKTTNDERMIERERPNDERTNEQPNAEHANNSA